MGSNEMKMEITLNLDEVLDEYEWGDVLSRMVRDCMKDFIWGEVKAKIKGHAELSNAVARISQKAIDELQDAAWRAIPVSAFHDKDK